MTFDKPKALQLKEECLWLDNLCQVKVSIIIAAFENMHRLPLTLESLGAQSHTNFECIVLLEEDASSTWSLLTGIRRNFELSCYSFHMTNTAEAYNRAAALASGQYIQFLRAGDIYLSSYALERMVELTLENFAPDFVYMGVRKLRDQKEPLPILEAFSRENLRRAIQPTLLAGCLIRRSSFLEKGRLDSSFTFLYELEWFCRMLHSSDFQFACDEFFSVERDARQWSTRERLQYISQMRRILRRYFGLWHSVLGWWAQQPWRILTNWIQRKKQGPSAFYTPHLPPYK